MIKTTGAEFCQFWNDDQMWPNGAWSEDECVQIGDQSIEPDDYHNVPVDAQVTLTGGMIYSTEGDELCSVESMFRRWRKAQSHKTIVVEIPIGAEGEFHSFVKSIKGKVI